MAAGADFILEALVREGIDHLFMVPGGLIDPFLPALARHPELKPIVATHEGGAAFMADGYARASGRFGAVLGIGGPGLCNMTTAVAAAKTDSSPLLVLSGEVPVDMEGLGQFQDASQASLDDTSVMRPVTRLSTTRRERQQPRPLVSSRTDLDARGATAGRSIFRSRTMSWFPTAREVCPGFRFLRRRCAAQPAGGRTARSRCLARERASPSLPAPASSTTLPPRR